MQSLTLKTILKAAGLAVTVLLLAASASFGAQVDLTAGPTTVTMPDGQTVPMWGLFCGSVDGGATCTDLKGGTQSGTTWQPPLIRVPEGSLTINLTNSLPSPVPTSLMIVGQLGGGLGSPTKVDSPAHAIQGTTWPGAGDTSDPGAVFIPPKQPKRIQSFGTEVPSVDPDASDDLTWDLKAGTYLIESGTHPSIQGPMGLYGVLIVDPVSATPKAYPGTPGVPYDRDLPLLLSEIDARQNAAVVAAVATPGFQENAVRALRDYVSSVTVENGGTGYAPGDVVTISGGGGALAMAEVGSPVGPSGEILTVDVTNGGRGYSSIPTALVTTGSGIGAVLVANLSLAGVALCSDGAAACYPPAVNYDPRYYLINGIAFDKTNPNASTFAAQGSGAGDNLLVRFVNAGLRMHVPSVVGLDMALIAEDGNVLPGTPKKQSEIFLAAGKTHDVMLKPSVAEFHTCSTTQAQSCTIDSDCPSPETCVTRTATYPVFDRQLSLSTNNQRDGGMQGYIGVLGAAAPVTGTTNAASTDVDHYFVVHGKTLSVSDPAKGVLGNDTNVYGATLFTPPGSAARECSGTTTACVVDLDCGADFCVTRFGLRPDGTFYYKPNAGFTGDSFEYKANGSGSAVMVTLEKCTSGNFCLGGEPTANPDGPYTSNIATVIQVNRPGVLGNDTDPDQHPLKAVFDSGTCTDVTLNADGSFIAKPGSVDPNTCAFTYRAENSQGTQSISTATVKVEFLPASGLVVNVMDGQHGWPMPDYRWIIEEDRTVRFDGNALPTPGHCSVAGTPCASNSVCPTGQTCEGIVPVAALATNFHTSHMPLVATGCVGNYSCGEGQSSIGIPTPLQFEVNPNKVHLDPLKKYYISILPGDGQNPVLSGAGGAVDTDPGPGETLRKFDIAMDCPDAPSFAPGTGLCGHGMGGAPIAAGQLAVDVKMLETPFPTAKLSVFVFEDDYPLSGEVDAGGGVDILAPHEPGLGGFNIVLGDQAGARGDPAGQPTFDMLNMPLSNSLAGTIDPVTGCDACAISPGSTDGLVGMVVTCPRHEAGGAGCSARLSPLAGQAVIANLYPGFYEVMATPGADRTARGEEWLQTNTLDGTKPHEAYIMPSEPGYFQEFGPGGFHVSIGFANPRIINGRLSEMHANLPGSGTVSGRVTTARISRTPDARIYSSGSYGDSLGFTQCYVSLGEPGGIDFAFTKCTSLCSNSHAACQADTDCGTGAGATCSDGSFKFTGIPYGNWRYTIFDQWNDIIVDGLSQPVTLSMTNPNVDVGDVPLMQWRTNLATRTFLDLNGDGVSQADEPGLPLLPTNIRYRDGSYMYFNNTDLAGYAGFNEIFPIFAWQLIETDSLRYKQTGVHVVYDAGGPADNTPGGGSSSIGANITNTKEAVGLPAALRVPGAVYCNDGDCAGESIADLSTSAPAPNPGSTARIDPPWVTTEAWQGFIGHTEFFEFGKIPFAENENGGIRGHVVYSSTRPFDDPALLLQLSWEPMVPNVTVNLYEKGTAPDGTESLTLIDTTKTSSWDDWAQGFRAPGVPNMNCPGQDANSPFYFTLKNSTQWLNPAMLLPENSRFKCYDGMAILNQAQPAPYDGMYQFPSVTSRHPVTGAPTGTNCTGCVTNPIGNGICNTFTHFCAAGNVGHACAGNTDCNPLMLRPGRYVVESVLPAGYETVKEEDKNILLGDAYIAPVTQQFPGLGNIYIMPDQAEVNSEFEPTSPQYPTANEGIQPRREGDTGSVEVFWPCVGKPRVVPDFISLFPLAGQVSPFAGATRRLCDRKEVTLEDQSTALAKFYVFTPTHVAGHFTGIITDDFASEFNPFSPSYGEKFAVPNLPISIKDFTGVEVARTYSDQWGTYNGMHYSSWEVNPPSPSGFGPTMPISCMNDPGPIPDPDHPGQMIVDPLYNPGYSQFCYETPRMPGVTFYMDTPVVPTMAFAEGYNPPDCAYPDTTPAILRVDGDGDGPWVSAASNLLKIKALGDKIVPNNAYSGPQATTPPFNQKFITRHYGFGLRPSTCPMTGSCDNVTIGGVNMRDVATWTDGLIEGKVPAGMPACTIQQRGQPAAQCGELVITADNGRRSIDTVTVTVGGKAPTRVSPGPNAIQAAIDAADAGDLIIVKPGTYREMLLMWQPVRLQGVGAAAVTIFADAHPAGKIDPWRRQVLCLFGIALNGRPISAGNPYDSDATNPFVCDPRMQFAVDRIPLEGILGWDTLVNGNLAELLQEPTLMGAYEGAGITVLAKGVKYPAGSDPWGIGTESAFPDGSVLLTNSDADCTANRSNFRCNPSRIDGLSITDSSQGGGGIFAHGWAHDLEISNNRVFANAGTLAGGISIGQGEFGDANLLNDAVPPLDGSILGRPDICGGPSLPTAKCPTGTELPYWFNANVYVHHNSVTHNASFGDALYSATPSAAGGVNIATGSDNYRFVYNWVCGNLSAGDGGGAAHLGFSYNGEISHNSILFNQSHNPTISTQGGGLLVGGAGVEGVTLACDGGTRDGLPCTDTTNSSDCPGGGTCTLLECGTVTDVDCPPGLSEGVGPNLVVDSNLLQGNTAQSGSGGGMRLQLVNGREVATFSSDPNRWYQVTVQNNIIVNNVAGWDGGGVSMQDALRVNFINNSVLSNDSTATAGVLLNSLMANRTSVPTNGTPTCGLGCTASLNQPAGLATMRNTPNLTDSLAGPVTCPVGYSGQDCKLVSLPVLANNVFWQNRSFHIEITGPGTGLLNQQNGVVLNPSLNQPNTGVCVPVPTPAADYWDIGVRGDTGPGDHSSTFTLDPQSSVLTAANGYPNPGGTTSDPDVDHQYCNGSRVPPENGGMGYLVPPGVGQENIPNPLFTLTPSLTKDEGGNWINMSYGPLSMFDPDGTTVLGRYVPTATSPTIDGVLSSDPTYAPAPAVDYFGHPRKTNGKVDIGAVEFDFAAYCDRNTVVDFDSTPMKYHVNTGPIPEIVPIQWHSTMKYRANTASDGVVLVQQFSPMRYFRNTSATPADATWMTPAFVDSGWTAGTYGVGYDTAGLPNALALIQTPVASGALSVYTRATFSIADVTAVRSLFFGADWDDGYVLWINGVEVRRANMPAGAPVGSTNASLHESSNGATPNYGTPVNLGAAAVAALHNGTNVMAIGVWNSGGASSTDLVIVPRLSVVYDWTTPAYNDAAWASGAYGVGYDAVALPNALALISTPVPSATASVYTRATFTIADVATVGTLYLGADYDDGYVAYINGHEVARSSMPAGTPNWNTAATSHESSNGAVPNYGTLVNITAAATPWLQNGTNVLAIGVWNTTLPSTDLLLVPRLSIVPNWTAENFDDSTWGSGTYGVGYDTGALPNALALIKTTVPTGTVSVYTRAEFDLTVADTTSMLLGVDYDDGYVAYVNGHEVARASMPSGSPNWNTTATLHESSNGTVPNYGAPMDIYAAALPYLHDGTNVLAIAVWNNPATTVPSTSTDLVLVPQLTLGRAEVCGDGLDNDCDGTIDEPSCNVAPLASLSVSSLGFGFAALDSLSPTQDLVLRNTGAGALTVNSPNFAATPGFIRVAPAFGTSCGMGGTFVVQAGASCAIGVQFAPTSLAGGATDYSAMLTINSNSISGAAEVTLTGTAAPPTSCIGRPDGAPCTDGNAWTCGDVCDGGVCEGTEMPEPAEVNDSLEVTDAGSSTTIRWTDSPGEFNVYRGTIVPEQAFAYNHACLNPAVSISGASIVDSLSPPLGEAFFYLVTRTDQCRESGPGWASDGTRIPSNGGCPSR